MIGDAIPLSFSVALIILSGWVVTAFLPYGPRVHLLYRLAISFMAGMGFVSLQLFFYSLLSITLSTLTVTALWLLLLCAAFAFEASREGLKVVIHSVDRTGDTIGWTGGLSLTIIIVQILYVFTYGLELPVNGWDAWAIWFGKAKAFFIDGAVTERAVTTTPHPDYPLLMPLTVAWVFTVLGEANDQLGKLLYSLQFVSLLLIFHYALSNFLSRKMNLVFTSLLSLAPIVIIHAGGLPVDAHPGGLYTGDFVGYSDLALSIYFIAGGAFIVMYITGLGAGNLIMAALFFSFAAWTKNEGLTMALMGVLLMTLAIFRSKKDGAIMFLKTLLICALIIIPWLTYKSSLGLESEYSSEFSLGNIIANLDRLPLIGSYLFIHLFLNTELYNLIFYLFVVMTFLNIRGLFNRTLLPLNLLFFGQLFIYILVFMITPVKLNVALATTLDRLILHLLPLAIFIAGMNYAAFIRRYEEKVRNKTEVIEGNTTASS